MALTSGGLRELQDHLIASARRGYPILISGAVFFAALAIVASWVDPRTLGLAWILGMMVIFPAGVLLGAILRIRVMTTDNPLGTLGGLVAGVQAFFIPVFIVVYQFVPQYLPLAVGLLGGAHFLPYSWIYRSRAYAFISISTAVASLGFGLGFVASAYTLVPAAIAAVYVAGTVWILFENRQWARSIRIGSQA